MDEDWTRTLVVDGDVIVFEISASGQVATVSEGGRIPSPSSFLGAIQYKDGEEHWRGVLRKDVPYPARVSEHFTDEELIDLYRTARPKR